MSPARDRDEERHDNCDHRTPLLPTKYSDRPEKKKPRSASTISAVVSIAALVSLACLAVVMFTAGRSSNGASSSLAQIKSAHLQEVAPVNNTAVEKGNETVVGDEGKEEAGGPPDEELPICDEADGAQCAKRIFGYCYERKPCRGMEPTLLPTFAPTTTEDCDPNNPPCSSWYLGICMAHYTCDMNIGPPTSLPTAKPTTLLTCDPQNPPCTSWIMGVCWAYADCTGEGKGKEGEKEGQGIKIGREQGRKVQRQGRFERKRGRKVRGFEMVGGTTLQF